jgi:peroxiredoxin
MKRFEEGEQAPDFSLPDHQGNQFSLAELAARQNVLLVFNLGFA